MARRPVSVLDENRQGDIPETLEREFLPIVEDESGIARVMRGIKALNGEGVIKLYQTGGTYHNKQAWLADIPPDVFNEQLVKDTYGPGSYRVHVRDGGNNLLQNGDLIIAGTPWSEQKQEIVSTSQNDAALTQILNRMAERDELMNRAIAALMEKTIVPPAPPQPQLGLAEIMTMVTQLMAVMKPAQAIGGISLEKTLEMFQVGLTMGKQIEHGGDPTDGMLQNALVSMLPALTNAFANPNNAVTPPAISNSPQIQRIQKPIDEKPTSDETEQINMLLKMVAKQLVKAAKENADPTKAADELLSKIPESSDEMLYNFLINPQWFEECCKFNEEIKNHQTWFANLHKNLLTAYGEADTIENGGESTVIDVPGKPL